MRWEKYPSEAVGIRFARINMTTAKAISAEMGCVLPTVNQHRRGTARIDSADHYVQLSNVSGAFVLIDDGLTLAQRKASGMTEAS